ncbi:MAG TPA: alpha/beta hydrolase-fold protein, partial [Planctomycetota bacterium]|nr:alpha/beta hydrolase-fold protein [Planctomycetota bacterium]
MRAIDTLKQQPPTRAAVEAFLQSHTFPIVEDRTVTFAYHGEATAVQLVHWIHGLESAQPFERLPGTDLWYLSMDLPRASRVEYKLAISHGPHRQLVRDPLNPNFARDPFGANSVVHGADYQVPDWTRPDEEARRGEVHPMRITGQALGDRDVRIYVPARFRRTRRYPLLIVHDGSDYLEFAGLQTVLDNLIHRLEVPPLITVLTDAGDRMREYAADPRHADFLVRDLLPQVESAWPVVREPAARCVMGASFGAVAALSTAWRYPGVFGRLLLQSGSFAFTDIGRHDLGPHWDPVVEFVNQFRRAPGRPADKVFLSCGCYEGLVYYNRSMVPLLQDTG